MFIICYAINDRDGFEQLLDFLARCRKIKDLDYADIPTVIVGCKCDLEEHRTVTKLEAEKFARDYRTGFIECSAKLNINVAEAFEEAIKRYVKKANTVRGTKMPRSQCAMF